MSPYSALFADVDPVLRLRIADSWSQQYHSTALKQDVPRNHSGVSALEVSGGVLHIGYISRRFEKYPGTQLMLQLFRLHNRKAVVVCLRWPSLWHPMCNLACGQGNIGLTVGSFLISWLRVLAGALLCVGAGRPQ